MALVSPGVEVSLIDESNYLPAPSNSVPFILCATAQNKVSGAGTGIAAGTIAATANKVYLISSQRDLALTFGNPFFYQTSAGSPINGFELNEYGLFAAYSALGVSNQCYVQRADIDLSELTASLTRPVGEPPNGTYWLDTVATAWGVFEWSTVTNEFTVKTPRVITSASDLSSGVPKNSLGNIGDYAIVATNANNPGYYKSPGNTVSNPAVAANSWVLIGSDDWKNSWPTVIGTATNPTLTSGSFYLNDVLVTFSGTTVAQLATTINSTMAGNAGVKAKAVNGKLEIYVDSRGTNDGSTDFGNGILDITNNSGSVLSGAGITPRLYYAPVLEFSPHYSVPQWRLTSTEPHPTGSIWMKTNNVNQGANLVVKKWNATTDLWVIQPCPLYENDQSANKALDPAGGGKNIGAESLYAQFDVNENDITTTGNDTFTVKIFERLATGTTIVTGSSTSPTFTSGNTFTIKASAKNSDTLTSSVTATLAGTTATDFVTAFVAANVANTTASVTSTGAVQIQHTQGGVIVLVNTSGTPVTDAGITTSVQGVKLVTPNDAANGLALSSWVPLTYTASATAPTQNPTADRKWYYSASDQVDIMIHDGTAWKGYLTVSNDSRGFNLTNTDPAGPIVSATAPTKQSDDTVLVYGDLWIDTSDLEQYPMIKRWQSVNSVDQWVMIDNTDKTTPNGILFADMRWATNGNTDPITADIPTITSLLSSNYLDPDAPDYTLYPTGLLAWNLRRSGFNVKKFAVNRFNTAAYPGFTGTVTDAWVSASGLLNTGAPYMGRKAVRSLVVAALKSGIDANQELREEQRQFNILAAPGYPELMGNMVALNNERSNTGFVIGDAPLRLSDASTDLDTWASNSANSNVDSETGLVTKDAYLGVFYPACQTTDLAGKTIVMPASHMMLRTLLRSDETSFPWLAPAGTRRGVVDNAITIGYVNAQTGAFVQTALRQGIRDTLYQRNINPITFLPGTGIVNYGNKTTATAPSALDRINVARLIAFIRGRLETIGKSFVFEPNDQQTRDEIGTAISSMFADLVAKRGVRDYLVVCDTSNNTPARIDRNELYVDIAVEPIKSVEFIYIPVRIKNTGEIDSGVVSSSSTI